MEIKKETSYINNDEIGTIKITTHEQKTNYRYDLNYSFNVGLAQKYGVKEAIFLNNLIFWIQHNKANNRNYYDGYY